MKVALAQINTTVGDLAANEAKILSAMSAAQSAGARLLVCPELAVTGYPPKDLLLRPGFIADQLACRDRLVAASGPGGAGAGLTVILGFAEPHDGPVGRGLYNSVAVARGGGIRSVHRKSLLPTYDVFDEGRYFDAAPAVAVADGPQGPMGVSICEDLWNDAGLVGRPLYHQNPIVALAESGARLLVNASASPFVWGKHELRRHLFGGQAARHGVPLVYCNQVGGNDELIFDGASMVLDDQGRVIAQARAFAEDLLVVDLDSPATNRIETIPGGVEAITQSLVLGVRDYAAKTGFRTAVLGLSGGIDSAVTAALAVEALGADNVFGVAMPSRYSSGHSVEDARQLAKSLGMAFEVMGIEGPHAAFETALAASFAGRSFDTTEENIQARCRGVLLMALSNKFGHLLLTTGNKSELAVGYCTLYGDMCGGLAVISDVPKTLIYQIAEHLNARSGREVIPRRTITKPPSAELRPDQTDQDSLPDYETLDGILERYVELEEGVGQIVAAGFDETVVRRVARLVDTAEYKRRQAAPGLKVTSRAFGFGRRMPIAQRYRA